MRASTVKASNWIGFCDERIDFAPVLARDSHSGYPRVPFASARAERERERERGGGRDC